MEATKMIESLAALRATFDKPPTDMELVRRALHAQVARANGVEMPPILNEDQRKIFAGRIDQLTEFLESEDGADAIELLMNSFKAFSEPPGIEPDNLVE